jgi:hypothetical protein
MILDLSTDLPLQLDRAVRELNSLLYSPRSAIIDTQGKDLVDVTDLCIDEITNVYYSDKSNQNLTGFDSQWPLMWLLDSTAIGGSLESVIDYTLFLKVWNGVRRNLNYYDFQLLPVGPDKKQYLQLKCPGNIVQVEFLPFIDETKQKYTLYSHEYNFLLDLSYTYICLTNAEVQAQATLLSVGKEASTIVDYWLKQLERVKEEFLKQRIITYLA